MKSWDRFLGRAPAAKSVLNLAIGDIKSCPFQPRQEFDEMELMELARSIQQVGLIQPVVVRKASSGFELVVGERRLRASRMAGLEEVPALVVDLDDERAASISLVENIQRKDLSFFEEAYAYARLIGEFNLTQEEVASRVGKSQSAVANKIRLLRLPDSIRSGIAPEVVTERHARALLKLESEEAQWEVLRAIYEKDLNVKQTEEMVDKIRQIISREIICDESRQKMSGYIKDVRIFLNTIKETVARAQDSGVDMFLLENDLPDEIELIIKVPKDKKI